MQSELDLDSMNAQARGRSGKEVSGPKGTGVEPAPDTACPPPSSFSPGPESETGDTKVKLKLLAWQQPACRGGKSRRERERGLLWTAHVAGSGMEGGKEELLFKFLWFRNKERTKGQVCQTRNASTFPLPFLPLPFPVVGPHHPACHRNMLSYEQQWDGAGLVHAGSLWVKTPGAISTGSPASGCKGPLHRCQAKVPLEWRQATGAGGGMGKAARWLQCWVVQRPPSSSFLALQSTEREEASRHGLQQAGLKLDSCQSSPLEV